MKSRSINVGDTVAGAYYGVPFAGTVERIDTVTNHTAYGFTVDLVPPVVVFRDTRKAILVHAEFDGGPTDYNKGLSYMEKGEPWKHL